MKTLFLLFLLLPSLTSAEPACALFFQGVNDAQIRRNFDAPAPPQSLAEYSLRTLEPFGPTREALERLHDSHWFLGNARNTLVHVVKNTLPFFEARRSDPRYSVLFRIIGEMTRPDGGFSWSEAGENFERKFIEKNGSFRALADVVNYYLENYSTVIHRKSIRELVESPGFVFYIRLAFPGLYDVTDATYELSRVILRADLRPFRYADVNDPQIKEALRQAQFIYDTQQLSGKEFTERMKLPFGYYADSIKFFLLDQNPKYKAFLTESVQKVFGKKYRFVRLEEGTVAVSRNAEFKEPELRKTELDIDNEIAIGYEYWESVLQDREDYYKQFPNKRPPPGVWRMDFSESKFQRAYKMTLDRINAEEASATSRSKN